jgi:hypothetical protein
VKKQIDECTITRVSQASVETWDSVEKGCAFPGCSRRPDATNWQADQEACLSQ